jgi:hypothetical protein
MCTLALRRSKSHGEPGTQGSGDRLCGMGQHELLIRLSAWVENSGRALELRTARTFRGGPSLRQLNQSVAYEDGVTKQQREGDVLAVLRYLVDQLAVSIDLAVECKAAKDYPWVAFYDEQRVVPEIGELWFLPAGDWRADALADLASEWREAPALSTDRVATHAVSAFGKDGKNFAHDAAQQAMSFARARAAVNYRYVGDPDNLTLAKAVVPVVVTQAPLFTCELTSDGQVLLSPAERFDVWLHSSREGRRRVYVRSETAVAHMADDLSAICQRLNRSIGGS